MSDMLELKPCPFCGGHARPMKCQVGIDGTMGCNRWVTITCSMCEINNGGKGGFMRPRYDTAEEAAKAWNTRADLNEALKAENEKLRDVIKKYAKIVASVSSNITLEIEKRPTEIDHEWIIAEMGILHRGSAHICKALSETISKFGGEK